MKRVTDPDGSRLDRSAIPADPAAAYVWFGASFAMLKAPGPGTGYSLRCSSRGVPTHDGLGNFGHGELVPADLTARYRRGHEPVADVRTSRIAEDGAPVASHVRDTLVNFQLALAAGKLRPDELIGEMEDGGRLDPRLTPETLATCPVVLDDAHQDWLYVTDTAIVTGEPLIACGAQVGRTLVAMAAIEQPSGAPELMFWAP